MLVLQHWPGWGLVVIALARCRGGFRLGCDVCDFRPDASILGKVCFGGPGFVFLFLSLLVSLGCFVICRQGAPRGGVWTVVSFGWLTLSQFECCIFDPSDPISTASRHDPSDHYSTTSRHDPSDPSSTTSRVIPPNPIEQLKTLYLQPI